MNDNDSFENNQKIETLQNENKTIKRLLNQTKNSLERHQNDYETLKQVHEDLKLHFSKLNKEKEEFAKKLHQLLNEKSDMHNQYESMKREFEAIIDIKQTEFEKIQRKLFSPDLDQNNLRRKIAGELEIQHRIDLESKQIDIDRIKDQNLNLRKENENLKARFESFKFELDKDMKELKEKHKLQLRDLGLEISSLNNNEGFERSLNEIIKEDKRIIDDLKLRLHDKEKVLDKTRKEKNLEMDNHFQKLSEIMQELNQEKNEKKNLIHENTNLKEKLILLENDLNQKHLNFNNHFKNVLLEKKDDYNTEDALAFKLFEQDSENKKNYILSLQQRYQSIFEKKIEIEKKLNEQIRLLKQEISEITDNFNKKMVELKFEQKQENLNERHSSLKKSRNDNNNFNESYYIKENKQLIENLRISETKISDLIQESNLLKQQLNLNLNNKFPEQNNLEILNMKIRDQNEKIRSLKTKNSKLKKKLNESNQKVMSLLSEKIIDQKSKSNVKEEMGFEISNMNKENYYFNKNENELDKIHKKYKQKTKKHENNLNNIKEIIEEGYNEFNPDVQYNYNSMMNIKRRNDFLLYDNQILRENARIFSLNLLNEK